MKLLLKNGRVLDPSSGIDGKMDILVDRGTISKLGKRIAAKGVKTVNLAGLTVCPGFLDIHVHLREPGQEWKETIATGARAAVAGGFTSVACMPNTVPPNDSRAVTEHIAGRAREAGLANVYPIGCVTKGMKGEELAEMGDMWEAGAAAFSDDGRPVRTSLMMRKALEYSKIFGVPIIDHCEDCDLVAGGVMHEGEASTRLGLAGWPPVAEDLVVQRDLLMAEYTGGRLHIAHMSTARSAEFVKRAKRKRLHVTCEVTPHHLTLTDEAVGEYDTNAKVNPPLRSRSDVRALCKALADGTVDCIATDHAPHHKDEKCVEFSRAPFGLVGLETAVSVCLDKLVRSKVISLGRMVELFTTGPAGVLGLAKGTLAPGADADITVLNLDRKITVDAADFHSRSANSPFLGWELQGAPVMTIVGGKIVNDVR